MSRLLALLILALLLWLLLARLVRRLLATPLGRAVSTAFGATGRVDQDRERREISAELVRCSGCGVHVPERQMATIDAGDEALCADCLRERRR